MSSRSPPRRRYSRSRSPVRRSRSPVSTTGGEVRALFLRGLNKRETRSEDIKDFFSKCGPVRDVYMPLDYRTREPRGLAYVTYEDARDAEAAYKEMEDQVLHGVPMKILWAQGHRKTSQEMRVSEDDRRYRRSPPRRRRSRTPPRRRYTPSPRRSRSPRRRYSPSPVRRRSRSPYSRRSPVRRSPRGYSPPARGRSRTPVRNVHSPPRSRSPRRDEGTPPRLVRRDSRSHSR
eukprot:TRINITY_DN88_c0_g1_i1.p1 TRINITY_DN88_c0_g1~~TRINITY_DN88_c0_g1_i1.p1  ORF type:complete len:232 (+),score=22.14 TRINITY_DN88_c0_g1_i1:16-711(+)